MQRGRAAKASKTQDALARNPASRRVDARIGKLQNATIRSFSSLTRFKTVGRIIVRKDSCERYSTVSTVVNGHSKLRKGGNKPAAPPHPTPRTAPKPRLVVASIRKSQAFQRHGGSTSEATVETTCHSPAKTCQEPAKNLPIACQRTANTCRGPAWNLPSAANDSRQPPPRRLRRDSAACQTSSIGTPMPMSRARLSRDKARAASAGRPNSGPISA